MIRQKLNTLTIESSHAEAKSMLEPLVMKVTRVVLRRGQEGNFLSLSDYLTNIKRKVNYLKR